MLWQRMLMAAAVVVVVAPAAAQAQSDSKKQQAKEHYERAVRLYDVGKYGEAIDEYQKAYLLVEDPVLLFNIAQAYRLWDKPEEAVRFYRNYLRRAPAATNRADVERKIAEMEKLVEERRRTPTTTTPPPADPSVTAPPVTPPTATAPPPAVPPPLDAPAGGLASPGLPAEPPPPARTRTVAYAFLIGGGALVLTSLVSGAVAASKAKQLEDAAKNRDFFNPDIEKSGKAANTVAIVSGLVGLAAAGTGGILLLTSRQKTTATADASPPPPRAALYGVAAPGYAGASARFTF